MRTTATIFVSFLTVVVLAAFANAALRTVELEKLTWSEIERATTDGYARVPDAARGDGVPTLNSQ